MSLSEFVQLLHVAAAFLFVTGLIGRDVLLWSARRADDLGKVRALLDASSPFERYMAIPGSFLVLLLGILTWWAQELPLWGEGTRWVTVALIVFASNIPLVPLVFLPRGRVFEEALAVATTTGRVTPQLSAAFRDPMVAAARWYELVSVAVVIVLMVVKPF